MGKLVDSVISKIDAVNPIHVKKLRKHIKDADSEYFKKAEDFLAKYVEILVSIDKDLDYGVHCYLKMCSDMMYEHVRFSESGKYSNTSFDDVNTKVYGNPEIMTYYMYGLLLSQFLWRHHYEILKFFTNSLGKYKKDVRNYLEIGGGHGLYISEASNIFGKDVKYDFIDISSSSIEIAKKFIGVGRVNYILEDIFKFNNGHQYDFITMGEVLEHMESPQDLLSRVRDMLTDKGHLFITTPTNAPTIDHIYLFRNIQEIKDIIERSGLNVVE